MPTQAQNLSREMILSAYKAALHLSRNLDKSANNFSKQTQFKPKQTQPVVSLSNLPVVSLSNLFAGYSND